MKMKMKKKKKILIPPPFFCFVCVCLDDVGSLTEESIVVHIVQSTSEEETYIY